MQLRMQKTSLLDAIQRVVGVVDKKNTIPVLSNILCRPDAATNTVKLTATNLEIGATATAMAIECDDAPITVPAQKLLEIVRELPDAVITLTTNDQNWISIECVKSKFRIAGLPETDFPNIMPLSGQAFTLPQATARNLFAHVAPFTSKDDSRYALTGVYLAASADGLRAVATDGHRLACITSPLPDGIENAAPVILPAKAAQEVKKLCEKENGDLLVTYGDTQMSFDTGATTIITRLIDAQFPDYQAVIPKESTAIAVLNREMVVSALKRVALMCSQTYLVKCAFGANALTLESMDPQVGNAVESFGIDYAAAPLTMGFNARYLLDVLGVTSGEHVQVALTDAVAPALLTTDSPLDEGFQCVIMPMRI